MITKIVILCSFIAIVVVWLVYYLFFGVKLGYVISNSPNDWALFANYLSGILTPILTFLTIFLLIQSLRLQNASNKTLESEVDRQKKSEFIAIFESRLFKAMETNNTVFKDVELTYYRFNGVVKEKGSKAVNSLEDYLYFKDNNCFDFSCKISVYIDDYIDGNDQIFSAIRRFYVTIQLVDFQLSDEKGFSSNIRKEYLELLINFTDYYAIRLVLIGMKYFSYDMAVSLRKHAEFNCVLESTGYKGYFKEI